MDRNYCLYRGKLLENPNKWVEGGYIHLHKTTYCFANEETADNEIHRIVYEKMTDWGLPNEHFMADVIPETVCKAIEGAFDKNNKQIFEKDIVLKGFEKYIIKWNAAQFCYSFYTLDGIEVSGFNTFTMPFVEVVGNIVDNPINGGCL